MFYNLNNEMIFCSNFCIEHLSFFVNYVVRGQSYGGLSRGENVLIISYLQMHIFVFITRVLKEQRKIPLWADKIFFVVLRVNVCWGFKEVLQMFWKHFMDFTFLFPIGRGSITNSMFGFGKKARGLVTLSTASRKSLNQMQI